MPWTKEDEEKPDKCHAHTLVVTCATPVSCLTSLLMKERCLVYSYGATIEVSDANNRSWECSSDVECLAALDDDIVVAGLRNCTIEVWHLSNGKPKLEHTLRGHRGPPACLYLHRKDRSTGPPHIISGSQGGAIYVWTPPTEESADYRLKCWGPAPTQLCLTGTELKDVHGLSALELESLQVGCPACVVPTMLTVPLYGLELAPHDTHQRPTD